MDFLSVGTTVRLRTSVDTYADNYTGVEFFTVPAGVIGTIIKTDPADSELPYYVHFDLTGMELSESQVDLWVFASDIEVVHESYATPSVEGLTRRITELEAAIQELADNLDGVEGERDVYLSALQRLGYSARLAGQIAREELDPVLVHQAEHANQFILGADHVWIAVGVYDVHIDTDAGYVDVWETQAEDDAPIAMARLGGEKDAATD